VCSTPAQKSSNLTLVTSFGLGTLSGIGSLVARNTEGKGHRMVFAGLPASGQGHKIMNEVYDSTHIVREQRWSEKYKIRLVKTKSVSVFLYIRFVGSFVCVCVCVADLE
jgi:hypothetical protein